MPSPFIKPRRGSLLEQLTANNLPSFDLNKSITNSCRRYLVVMDSLIGTTNGVQALLRMSSDGGATFDTTAGSYSWVDFRIGPGGAAAGGSASSQTSINITGGGNTETIKNTAIDSGLSGWFFLFNPSSTTGVKQIIGQTTFQSGNTVTAVASTIAGRWGPAAAPVPMNAFRIFPSSGSWASGVVSVYKMPQF